ncbi:MAG: alpha/beta fold hydrolase [Acidobacteriota bacterium]
MSSLRLVRQSGGRYEVIEQDFSFQHRDGKRLNCTVRLPHAGTRLPVIVVAPGFRGFKDWGFFPYLACRLAESGLLSLAFNHALSGVGEQDREITDFEAFSRNSTTQELNDWELLLDSILSASFPYSNRARLDALGVVGHSRGGSYGLLMATRFRPIRSVVTWGSIQTFQRYTAEQKQQWRQSGRLELGASSQGQPLFLRTAALDALERNEARLDVLRAVRELTIPVLILQGREDRVVPLADALRLWQCSDQRLCRLHVVEQAGHTFRTQHPFTSASMPLREATEQTVGWFQRTLR